MIKSMTGYGRNKLEIEKRTYEVEIRTVNHKYIDISVKIPRNISYLEENIKKEICSLISRGKVEVMVTFVNNSALGKKITINQELVKMYVEELTKLGEQNQINNNISVMELAKFPEVLTIHNEEEEEELWKELKECLAGALDNLIQMRQKEGTKIAEDLGERIEQVSKDTQKISVYSTRLVEEYVVKLEQRIKDILKTEIIDKDRIAQQVVIYSDKCSIEEELTRLKSHCIQLKELLEETKPVGKKMDFLIQEMNRETNTIGSKSSNLEITNLVINMKTQLEDIREQVQNIE